ncbi:MAG: hypothetical protein S4CHLAM2_10890 [Chlamydiales bacterium]|nr:hypothetical protein [Chlamydiales bacterium]
MTKDERFLFELYRQLQQSGMDTFDPHKIAETLGYNERLTKNILNGLMRANLVKRYNEDEVGLTPRGLEVVRLLR